MFFSWLRNRRRKQWLAEGQPSRWEVWLRKGVWQYQHLDDQQRQRVRDFVTVMLHEKEWAGGSGLDVTEQMQVTIAGQAALLTLGFGRPYYFDRLKTIILYASTYQQQPASTEGLLIGQVNETFPSPERLLGESWQGGPIVLAWNVVERDGRNSRRRRSVVLHEFAHHMDGLNGTTDGSPPMTSYEFEKRWYRITDMEYRRLLKFARMNQPTLLDHYGATSHAEFFAVATECFFTTPHEFARQHSQLYAVLEQLFGQDPRNWLPDFHSEQGSA